MTKFARTEITRGTTMTMIEAILANLIANALIIVALIWFGWALHFIGF